MATAVKSLRDARTEKEIATLGRDNFDVGDFGILCDGYHVWLSEQALGETRSQRIEIPKKTFDRLVDFYVGRRPVPITKRRKR